jgi:hypothetical protein
MFFFCTCWCCFLCIYTIHAREWVIVVRSCCFSPWLPACLPACLSACLPESLNACLNACLPRSFFLGSFALVLGSFGFVLGLVGSVWGCLPRLLVHGSGFCHPFCAHALCAYVCVSACVVRSLRVLLRSFWVRLASFWVRFGFGWLGLGLFAPSVSAWQWLLLSFFAPTRFVRMCAWARAWFVRFGFVCARFGFVWVRLGFGWLGLGLFAPYPFLRSRAIIILYYLNIHYIYNNHPYIIERMIKFCTCT